MLNFSSWEYKDKIRETDVAVDANFLFNLT